MPLRVERNHDTAKEKLEHAKASNHTHPHSGLAFAITRPGELLPPVQKTVTMPAYRDNPRQSNARTRASGPAPGRTDDEAYSYTLPSTQRISSAQISTREKAWVVQASVQQFNPTTPRCSYM